MPACDKPQKLFAGPSIAGKWLASALTAAVAQINHTTLTALHNYRARGPKETKGG
jgi:hypothetical protein